MNRFPPALLACLAFLAAGSAQTQEDHRPNIVVILADDLGYGDPGFQGTDSKIETPNLDRLAAQGMIFSDAHAPGSVCVPSRYGLLTGRFAMRAGGFRPKREAVIADEVLTLPAFLQSQGYATAMIGKWHLGFDGGPKHDYAADLLGGPCDRGFDSWYGIPASLDIPPYFYVRDRRAVAAPSGTIEKSNTEGWTPIQGAFWREGGNAPGFVHEEVLPSFRSEAIATLAQLAGGEEPFFLYFALPAPHTPWLPSKKFRGRSAVPMYGDFVMQVDDVVGGVLDALEKLNADENTIVVFTSDNGPVWFPQDVENHHHSSVGPLRGMKADAWEGGHRMPFVVRWPERIVPSTNSDRTLCFTDLFATCAEVLGVPLPKGAAPDSVSFLPTLDGQSQRQRPPMILKGNGSVVRWGKWKLINHLGSGGFSNPPRERPTPEGPKGQLYDLEADPSEQRNLWSAHPEVVARFEKIRHALQHGG